MRRTVIVLALALSFGATVAPTLAATTTSLAPADRYFGRLKMSILGIRNSLKDLSERVDLHPEDGQHVYDKAVLVEDALHDWQRQYPHDPWIPRYAYTLAQLYGKVDTDDARTHRDQMLDWLGATYPESEYAQLPRE